MRTEPGCHLYCTAFRIVLLLHFNIAKLFTDHILFQENTRFKMSTKTDLLSFRLSVVSLLLSLVL